MMVGGRIDSEQCWFSLDSIRRGSRLRVPNWFMPQPPAPNMQPLLTLLKNGFKKFKDGRARRRQKLNLFIAQWINKLRCESPQLGAHTRSL